MMAPAPVEAARQCEEKREEDSSFLNKKKQGRMPSIGRRKE
jgi:hypothetical protein